MHPAQTLERLAPHLERVGITRVANITGLDRVGIPVAVAVRPNARSLSVSQGKGLDIDAAKASAVGESLEAHHAEFNDCLVRLESYEHLRRTLPSVDPERLPLSRTTTYTPWQPIPWTLGRSLPGGEPVWVPYELVHANACLPRVPGSGCFVCSTNGLAAGNTIGEATLHALCEAVERDACALWEHRPWDERRATELDPATVSDPSCRELLDRFDAADIDVLVWDVTSDLPLPCYRVIVLDRQADPLIAPYPAAFGAGCHPDPGVALTRALTEAAQSRLTVISGARDDLTRERYRAFQSPQAIRTYREMARSWSGRASFTEPVLPSAGSVDEDLSLCLDALADAGLGEVVVVDLSRDDLPVSVVRVLALDLEGPVESPSYRPGPRALARQP
ncbi:YcaO-like family protein [Fodinibacter luteus]|uniref:YcaO-like family protein n=1 Tax=Fodinibacter luteus TaxID=552064 RepID=A0ABP8KAJ4_9MICO